ncbi:MAG: tyrosine--tRNA ligase, partial [Actinobacteria bacterium]|nr:tyrosine--tRNA ligase [Actinomycetota bacterium]
MDLWDDLQWRGLAYQWTGGDELPKRLREGPLTLYCGFDPSAPSLHIGNLVGLMALRRFQRAGHRPIAIAGGATGMIGDPSGRSEERNLLSSDELVANVASIEEQIRRFIDLDGGGSLRNNADWLSTMPFVAFLRDVGKHFSVNVMLAKESVKGRLESESGISYTEFSYMLMQAYDFVHLYQEYGCELQVGGSDQYGNIVAGVDLARRMHAATLYGFTWPLVTRSDGVKMGKTAEGAVWLDAERTSPFAFYQWFVRVPDGDAGTFLR